MIEAYEVDSLTVQKWLSDDWGEPTYAEVAATGYVIYKEKLVRSLEGEEVISSASVLFSEKIETTLSRALSQKDRIKLAGEDYFRSIMEIRKPKALSSPHYEVYLV